MPFASPFSLTLTLLVAIAAPVFPEGASPTPTAPVASTTPRDYEHVDLETLHDWAVEGDPRAMLEMGNVDLEGDPSQMRDSDPKSAAYWFRLAAEKGNAEAAVSLGVLYEQGRGVPHSDGEAVRWYRRAALRGHPNGQACLGYHLKEGKGVKKYYAEALAWFKKAAAQGHVQSYSDLGELYERGLGTPKNFPEAFYWWRKAADADDPYAQNHLGELYRDGKGVKRDLKEAARWFEKAARYNFIARRNLAKLRRMKR
jgi:hypothetical protein